MFNETPDHSEEAVASLAHRFWEEEGKPEGQAEAHWRRAEEQILKEGSGRLAEQPALDVNALDEDIAVEDDEALVDEPVPELQEATA